MVASDGTLYVTDYYSAQVRKLVNSGSGWQVDTVNIGWSTSCHTLPSLVSSPYGLGIDANDALYTFDANCAVLKRLSPPPPPPPPTLLEHFVAAASCPGAGHRIVAAAGHVVDSVAGGGWSADAVQAGPSASPGWLTGVPELVAANEVAATVDPYSIADNAWVLRGGAGVRVHTGARPAVGSAAGGLSVAVWFRIDDPTLNNGVLVALELVMAAPSVPGDNVTLTIGNMYFLGPYTPIVSVRGLWCCGPGSTTTTSEVDYGAHATARAPCPAREWRVTTGSRAARRSLLGPYLRVLATAQRRVAVRAGRVAARGVRTRRRRPPHGALVQRCTAGCRVRCVHAAMPPSRVPDGRLRPLLHVCIR